MAFDGPQEDRLAIRELIDTYNSAVILTDKARWQDTWTEDASWILLGNEINGRDNIVAAWEGAMSQFKFVSFMAAPGSLTITAQESDSDKANGLVHVRETLVSLDGLSRHIFGLYKDRYQKHEDGRWQFSHRDYSILHEY